jgi:aminopeptidase N
MQTHTIFAQARKRWKHASLPALSLYAFTFIPPAIAGQQSYHDFGDPNVWQWPPTRTYHVENYKLSFHFDQANGEIFGDELITLRSFEPHFYKLYLNSSELSIDSVTLEHLNGASTALKYSPQDPRLWIRLDREYGPASTLRLRIIYHGFPHTGLFFVNPNSQYPRLLPEVFSQGETEFNHYWFPCWDYPNDMARSETITTVPEGQTVVSNGKLIKVTRSSGLVTYDWVENVPHSSYLISIAVGPWRKFSDEYEGKPVDYYVSPSVNEATARRSFRLTPDMLAFFSRATAVDYPYEQYAQDTVENYIFGGQENVSATTLTDATLHDERAEQDYPSTDLVSHEMGQHWFGDYVQARDWANIWLNEGFATYMEALYTQFREGNDAYRFAIYQDRLMEQQEDRESYRRPLVDRHYSDPMDMIDRTTHEKGADVLDMLRYVVDGSDTTTHPASQKEILFQALHNYLASNHTQSVDTHDLIRAVRETTGTEVGWFFDEWVYMAGHPDYRVKASYDSTKRIENVIVTQTQQVDSETPVFKMPIELAFFGKNGEKKKIQVWDDLRQQKFDIELSFEPEWVDFDPDDFVDKTVEFSKPTSSLIAEMEKDPSMMSRLWAVQQCGQVGDENRDGVVSALAHVLNTDSFPAVRAAATTSLGKIGTERAKYLLLVALHQSNSQVRQAVVEALGAFSHEPLVYRQLVDSLHDDLSYAAQAAAAEAVGKSGVAGSFDVLRAEVLTRPDIHVMRASLHGLVATKDARAVSILIAEAQPGVEERVRLSALNDLSETKEWVGPNDEPGLEAVVEAALHDSFAPTQDAGQELVGIYHLSQFDKDVEKRSQDAPMAMERRAATRVLEELHGQK